MIRYYEFDSRRKILNGETVQAVSIEYRPRDIMQMPTSTLIWVPEKRIREFLEEFMPADAS